MKPSERGSKIELQNGMHFLTTLSREPGRCKKKEREIESWPVQLPRADPARITASLSLSFCIGQALATE